MSTDTCTATNGQRANGDDHGALLPPQNIEAERQVIGACLIDDEVIPVVRRIVRPESFWRESHAATFRAICEMNDAGKPVDPTVLCEHLKIDFVRPGAGECGLSADDVYELASAAPHAVNAQYHAAIVADLAERRRVIEALQDTIRRAYEADVATDELVRDHAAVLAESPRGDLPEFSGPPRKIIATLKPVPPLDPAMLPEPLHGWLADIAERMRCPLDYPAAAAITAISAVIGRKVGIRPKRRDDWLVVPNLWGAVVGEPGDMKSPAVQEALRPLGRLVAMAMERHKAELERHGREQLVFKAERGAAKKRLENAAKGAKGQAVASRAELMKLAEAAAAEDAPPEPNLRRYMTNDPTVEKLAELLQGNPNGLLLYRDELNAFLRTLDKQGHESDRGFYLEGWAGNGSYTWDRIGRGTGHVPHCVISVFGSIQPGPLASQVRRSTDGAEADGLVQRFQMLVYPDSGIEFRIVDRYPSTEAKNRAFTIVEHLDAKRPEDLGAARDEGDPEGVPYLRFDADAQQFFYEWWKDLEAKLRGDEPPEIKSHLAKYRSLMPSLALLFHLVDVVDPDAVDPVSNGVPLRAAELAAGWCDYLEAHARRVYDLADGGDIQPARTLAAKLAEGKLPAEGKPFFQARDVAKKGWSGLDDAKAAEKALGILEDHGWIAAVEKHPERRGGRPTTHYYVNPAARRGGRP